MHKYHQGEYVARIEFDIYLEVPPEPVSVPAPAAVMNLAENMAAASIEDAKDEKEEKDEKKEA